MKYFALYFYYIEWHKTRDDLYFFYFQVDT